MDYDEIQKNVSEKMQKRISALKDAIAATEFFLTACDEYQASCERLQMLNQEEFDIRDAYLRVHARLLSLRARLSLYGKFEWLQSCEQDIPGDAEMLIKTLHEKAQHASNFEKAVFEAQSDECVEFSVDVKEEKAAWDKWKNNT